MSKIKININAICEAVLTESGAKAAIKYTRKQWKAGNVIKWQLYEVIAAFDLYSGDDIPFEKNQIVFDDKGPHVEVEYDDPLDFSTPLKSVGRSIGRSVLGKKLPKIDLDNI